MVDEKKDLGNAIALNSSLFNGARLVGPAIGGLAIAWLGEGICFLLNALSFVAVLGALGLVRVPRLHRAVSKTAPLQNLKDGVRYILGSAPISAILLLLSFISFFGTPYSVLMPVFATHQLGGNAKTLGWLMSSAGAGALVGAIFLASRPSVVGLGRLIAGATAVFAVTIAAFSLSHVRLFSMGALVFAGMAMMIAIGGSNIIIQTIVDDDKRGRVMSFYTVALMGTAPFGSLLSGWVAERWGAPRTLIAGAAVLLAAAVIFARRLRALRSDIRPLYVKLGLLRSATLDMPTDPVQANEVPE
jgi:MFS family permease